MKKFHVNIIAVCAILLSGVLLTSCMKSNVDNNNTDSQFAGLMAFNLVPEKTIAIAIGGNYLTNQPLAFNGYTGTYLAVYPGLRTVESFDYSNSSSLASATDSFQSNKYYSVFVIGANGSYQNVLVNDNFDSLSSSSGKAYIRYINAINSSANLTVAISDNTGEVVNTNSAFASVSDFVAVTPGDVTITANNGSTINANRTITTEAKNVYTVLLAPEASSGAQIKYILNGVLDNASGQKVSSAARTATIK